MLFRSAALPSSPPEAAIPEIFGLGDLVAALAKVGTSTSEPITRAQTVNFFNFSPYFFTEFAM